MRILLPTGEKKMVFYPRELGVAKKTWNLHELPWPWRGRIPAIFIE
jgi:hypothetical protein